MAKFDVTKIEGYATMSAEDKVKALESFEYDDGTAEIERFKNAITKANKEASEWKNKHNALLSEEERKKQESEDAFKQMQDELAKLREEKQVSENKSRFVALGYDEELATETATAMVKGDLNTVFANQKRFLEAHDKAIKAETLKQTPTPPAGGTNNATNFAKQIEEANAMGDYVRVAALTRLQGETLNN